MNRPDFSVQMLCNVMNAIAEFKEILDLSKEVSRDKRYKNW